MATTATSHVGPRPPRAIDHDPNQIDVMRRFAFRGFYGDASRPDVSSRAQLERLLADDAEDIAAARRAGKDSDW
ncbi:MAG: hypothetical protein ACK5PW_08075 [Burkholderiales bacterium]|jgi:hypothetical protein